MFLRQEKWAVLTVSGCKADIDLGIIALPRPLVLTLRLVRKSDAIKDEKMRNSASALIDSLS